LNVDLEKVLREEDLSVLKAPPDVWLFKNLMYLLANLGSLNEVLKGI
jgi:hypothetical protein